MMYGLLGKSLMHSFSKSFFEDKFSKLSLNSTYNLFEMDSIEQFVDLLNETPELAGLNVTIPYKQQILPFLNEIDSVAERIGSVNVVKISNGKTTGFNSDYYGFKQSLLNFIPNVKEKKIKALILGYGGAAKTVEFVLNEFNIASTIVSRNKTEKTKNYVELNEEIISNYKLIINTTPLGMYPNIELYPEIPYGYISKSHFCYDLIYNPNETMFLNNSKKYGAKTKNGLEMLYIQAEKSWEIWNS